MQKYKNFWKRIVTLFKEKDVFHHASAITFNLVICAFPFVLLLISIVGYVLSYETAFSEVLRYGQEILPRVIYQSGGSEPVQEVISIKNLLAPLVNVRKVFGIVGIAVLIFFSLGLFHTIKHVVFAVMGAKDRNHLLWELVHNFFTFGLVGGIFIFLSIAISIFSVISVQSITVPITGQIIELSALYQFLQTAIPLLFTLLIIYILIRYISEKRLKRFSAFIGALIFTILFTLARIGVGYYLGYTFSRYQYYYQGYTVPVIIGVWAFYSAVLFVVSVIVAKAYQDVFQQAPLKENPYNKIS